MKKINLLITLFFLCLLSTGYAQAVSTLANLTANGGVSVAPSGTIYVSHFGPLPANPAIGNDMYKVNPLTGAVEQIVTDSFVIASGNTITPDGIIYQSNFVGNKISKLDTNGLIIKLDFAQVPGPVGIEMGENDTLIVCSCAGSNALKKVSPDGLVVDFVTNAGGQFACANGITKDDAGNFYVTNFSDGRVNKVTPDGTVTLVGNTGIGSGHIVYNPLNSKLYIASYSGNKIFEMTLSGTVALLAGTGAAGANDSSDPILATFDKPNGIGLSPDGCSLYISQDQNALREIKLLETACSPMSIKDSPQVSNLRFYPNPSTSLLFIDNPEQLNLGGFTLFDLQGKKVLETDRLKQGIDLSSLPPGAYLGQIRLRSGREYAQMIIKE